MRYETTGIAIITAGLAACAANSAGYRELAGDYHQAAAVPLPQDDGSKLFAEQATLVLEPLVAAVVQRNPTVELARQGWRAALASYPQATSYDDPTIGVTLAPLSLLDPDVKLGLGAQITQPLPYPGKRRLRGQVALAEADAARQDYRAVQQRLALMAAQLYYDYYLLERSLAVNNDYLQLLGEYSQTINGYLATGRAWQEDALQLDLDRAELHKQRVVLESDRDITIAQLNALLHRPQRSSLPPPPTELAIPTALSLTRPTLTDQALAHRPELRAVAARERGAAAGLQLADRDYYPDFRVTGTYNRMWPMLSHQLMVGLTVALPVTRARRRASTDAARAKQARLRASHTSQLDDVRRDVEVAYRRVEQADEAATLYRDQALPAAEARVRAVRLGLDAGRTTFIEVIRSEQQLRLFQLRYYAALTDSYRRRAELAWATGQRPGSPLTTEVPGDH